MYLFHLSFVKIYVMGTQNSNLHLKHSDDKPSNSLWLFKLKQVLESRKFRCSMKSFYTA